MKKEFNEHEAIGRFYMAEEIINSNICPGSGYERTLESFQDMLDEAEGKGVKDELCQILSNVTLFKYSYMGVGYDRLYYGGWGDIEHVTQSRVVSARDIRLNLEVPAMGMNRVGSSCAAVDYSYKEGDPTIIQEDMSLHRALLWGTYHPTV